MFRNRLTWITLLVLILAIGCTKQTPEERIVGLRSHYTAELNSFIATTQTPPLPEPMDETEGMEEDEISGEIEEEDLAPTGPLLTDVLLDVIVMHDANENLAGITLDVTQAGPDGKEKGNYRFYIETSNLARGQQSQVNNVWEDVDYQDGDGFYVEVRRGVPAAERGDYQEFSP